MRIYRNGVYIGILICVISFFIMIFAKFFHIVPTLKMLLLYVDQINEFIFNIALGLFCSALVVVLTYIGAYNIEKKNNIGLLMYYCSKYILELGELISKLYKFSETGNISFNLDELKKKISEDSEINQLVKSITKLYEERLFALDGFFPFFKRNKRNIEINKLMYKMAYINENLKVFEKTYNIKNNILYKSELGNNTKELENALKIFAQIDSKNEYSKFISTYEKVVNNYPLKTIYNTNWEDECL